MSENQKGTFTFNLELPKADYMDVCKLSAVYGVSVEELLENFLCDLVYGKGSNGSDECYHARKWFDRCWFGMTAEDTFLKYLIENADIDDFVERYQCLQECEEELKQLQEGEEKEAEDWKKEIDYQQARLKEYYDDYANDAGKPESYEDGVATIMEWYKDSNSRLEVIEE
ncbi:MAG: hypothetical protein SOW08_08025 [Lachnospiraceae bacterium]|nr:hypothetical protein [Lachnospiraceae bacterium]